MELNLFSHKFNFFIAFLSLSILKFYSVDVPKNYEKPFEYRKDKMVYKLVPFVMKIGGLLGYGDEPTVFKQLFHKSIETNIPFNPDIKKVDRIINNVNVRIYSPVSKDLPGNAPIMIYYHGGGFVAGLLEMFDEYLTQVALKLNIVAIAVEYRLAPEHPFPAATNDCYSVTKYILESSNEFGNTDKVILAGDSAGGNAVAAVTQRLKAENMKMPKLQILIYPWLQMFNFKTASNIKYNDPHRFGAKFMLWYLGITEFNHTEILSDLIVKNDHTVLINDKEIKEKLLSYTDSNMIADEYKIGYKYYDDYDVKHHFPSKSIENDLLKDPKISGLLRKMFTAEVSPGLADPEKLIGLPEALFIISEVDALKDDGMMYAERLRSAGGKVKIDYYENAMHGMSQRVGQDGLNVARDMQNSMIEFIKENI